MVITSASRIAAVVGEGVMVEVGMGKFVAVWCKVGAVGVWVAKAIPGIFSGQRTQAATNKPTSTRMRYQRRGTLGLGSTG